MVGVAFEDKLVLRQQHAHRLDRVERHPVGAGHDGLDRPLRQAGHEARQKRAHGRFGERLQADIDEVALARTPGGPLVQQLRAGEGHDVDGDGAAPLEQVVDEVQQARVGVVVVLEDEHDRRRGGEPFEERPPRPEQLVRAPAGLDAEQGQEGRLDPAALVRVGHVLGHGRGDLGAGRRLVVGLQQARAAADHLAQRPERDALAVGRAAALVPPDRLDQAVDVLEELPGQAASCRCRPGR